MWRELTSWNNLWLAAKLALKGKRGARSAAAFDHQLADNLLGLQTDLRSRLYQPGAYRHFYIHEPKRRKISAAPFRDRVAHHALCNVMEPVFEARFIERSYANRAGKGTHRAIDEAQNMARRFGFALRMDIARHFPSIDHAILKAEIAAVIHERDILWLVDVILASGKDALTEERAPVLYPGDDLFALARPCGLPIGNLTSQFWSNVYMNPFDWFVTRELGCQAYLRYVDDFILFDDDKRRLWRWRDAIFERLARLRLTAHESEAQVFPTSAGIPWLGFVVYPTHRLLKRRNAVAFTRRFRRNLDLYAQGDISFAEFDASAQGWIAHVNHADTWGLREHIFGQNAIRPPAPK